MTKTNSVTKRMLALLLAVLMMFSGMAVSASAATAGTPSEPTTQPTAPAVPTSIPAPTLTKSDADKTITVKLPVVPGYKVYIQVSPSASYVDLNNGSWLYVNLTPGQKYTFKAYIGKPDGSLLYSPEKSETIKDKHAAPNAPVASKVTSKSITVTKVTDCEYRLTDEKGNVVKTYNWSDKTVVFEGLSANTKYVLSIRRKETTTKYASDPVSITVRTLKAGDKTAVGKPVLLDKTDTTVIVKCAEADKDKKIEFSIDKGKTWQYSGEFKNLKANTIYGVIARRAYDPAVQDPNPSSAILEFRTNSKPRVEASLADCKVTFAEGKIYANAPIEVSVSGDGPDDLYLAEFGDTRFIPDYIYFDAKGEQFPIKNGKTEVIPGSAHANSKTTMYVVFKVERYNGGNNWKPAGTITLEKEVEVGPNRNVFTVIGEFFVTAFNFLFNTLPDLILSTGGLWEKGLALLFGMFDDIGLTK
ncbi:MAG: hypothetical protein IKW12_03230 [Clostridia bacterium]|nr:hypothetical protein [Clostridia bacterium]